MSRTMAEFRNERKQDLVNVLGGKCQICGFNSYLSALEFHHENPREKTFGLSDSKNRNKNIQECLKEAKKCFLLCSNCHRGIHEGILKTPSNHIFLEDIAQQVVDKNNRSKQLSSENRFCPNCGGRKSYEAILCSVCARKLTQKVEHPNREELKNLIRTTPFTQIGKKYQVSRESVRKWCRQMHLPDTKKEINGYSDEKWLLI